MVRPLLQSYGIRLPNRVRVQLATVAEITERMGTGHSGYTATRRTGNGPARVTELRIVRGLPATQFGSVLAHEMGHSWLAGCPRGGRTRQDEEGLCELVASWWLLRRGGPLARSLLDSMRSNPDPIYGEGFRRARRATEALTPVQIVAQVTRIGHL
jgi:hypothetical protein